MSDFGEDGFGRCRGCGEWTRHESVMLAGMALCTRCSSAANGPDHLHKALASVLGARHWQAFCDAWLAIGLAALWPDPRDLGRQIGRVVRKGPRR